MSMGNDALTVKQTEMTAASDKKNKTFENAMVAVGSLVTYLIGTAFKTILTVLKMIAVKIVRGADPLSADIRRFAAKRLGKLRRKHEGIRKNVIEWHGRYPSRAKNVGAVRAVFLQIGDAFASIKDKKKLVKTIVNYTVPVVSAAFFVCVVADKASADYGVTVEYNGQEIGVVYEESVLDVAQEVIADRSAYYDTGSDTYITATLSLKPLGVQDEVIDEQTLADAIQEQIIDVQLPETFGEEISDGSEETEGEELNIYGASENPSYDVFADGDRERAFVVTVDSEVIGAVKENDDINEFLENIKEQYMGEGVEEVSFDKEIECTYEQFVDPADIVSQQEIIDMLDSNVEEPVYYEVREGDNPWNIARDNGMTTDELKECFITFDGERIDDITEYCPIGAVVQLSEEVPYLQVLTTKEVVYNEAIDYEIVKTKDPDMYKGDSAVDVKGVEGEKRVTARVTYRGDTPVSTEVLSEVVLSEPVTKYMRVGTRETVTPVSTGSGGSGEYFWPVDGGKISAYQGDGRGHKGIDIAAPYGTPIYAAESGTVIETGGGWNGGYGNCVRIQHADGNVTVYAHQSSIAINYGDYVVKGQLIGYVGSTGDSTGNHLHFEVRSNGTYANPVNYVSQY